MSLALERFPPDILANITGRLSAHEQNLLLSRCGSHALRRRLIEHGIAHATLPESWATQRGFEWLSSLRGLLSVSVTFPNISSTSIRKLIALLPRSLAHLELISFDMQHLMRSDDFETDPSLSAYTMCGYRCWNVSAQFPSLLSLTITSEGAKDSRGGYDEVRADELRFPPAEPHFYNRFLSLLPQSLQYLKIDDIGDWNISGGLWSALPPYLTSLGGTLQGPVPSQDTPELLARSLRSMDLILRPSKREISDDCGGGFGNPLPSLHLLAFPPNLARLSVKGCEFFQFDTVPALPSKLIKLKLTSKQMDLSQVFSLIPPSVTDLSIKTKKGKPFTPGMLFSRQSVQPRRNLKRLTMNVSHDVTLATELYNLTLLTFPAVEELIFDHRASQGLVLSHLELFDQPSPLRVLRAMMHPEVSQKACTMLPCITSLEVLVPSSCESTPLELSALPASCTSVKVSGGSFPLQTLAKLPPTVLHFEPSAVSVSEKDAHLFARYYAPCNPEVASVLASPSTMDVDTDLASSSVHTPRELTKFTFNWLFAFRRLSGAGASSFVLFPLPQGTISGIEVDISSYQGLVPRTITDLRLTRADELPFNNTWCNPETLPNLRKLVIQRAMPRDLDLGDFSCLESFHSGGISASCISRCPPNLTSLKARQEITLSSKFTPLPNSMRKIRCGMSFRPITALPADCSNMVSFVTYGQNNLQDMPTLLQKLPPTLTRIGFRVIGENLVRHPWLSAARLSQCFPNLREIDIGPESRVTIQALEQLHGAGSDVKVIGGTMGPLESFDDLVKVSGGVLVSDSSVAQMVRRTVKAVFPRCVSNTEQSPWPTSFALKESFWPLIASSFPPTITSIDIKFDNIRLRGSGVDLLPKQTLTRLHLNVVAHTHELYDRLSSFPNLTDLRFYDDADAWCLNKIPRTVTLLTLAGHAWPGGSKLAELPSSVTHLKFSHMDVKDEHLESLPPTVICLDLQNYQHTSISLKTIECVPATLKILKGSIDRHTALSDIREAARAKGLVWVGLPDHEEYIGK